MSRRMADTVLCSGQGLTYGFCLYHFCPFSVVDVADDQVNGGHSAVFRARPDLWLFVYMIVFLFQLLTLTMIR